AFHENRSAVHPGEASAIGRSDLTAGVAVHSNKAAAHFAADPVRRVSRDLNLASFHVGSEMHSCVADNRNAAPCHAATNPFHAARIAADFDLITSVTFHIEEINHAALTLAKEQRQCPDFTVA